MRKFLPVVLLLLLAPLARTQTIVNVVSGVVTANIGVSNTFKVVVNQNITSVVLTAAQTPVGGQQVTLFFSENATGGFSVTFGGNITNACTVTTTASTTTACVFQYDATTGTWYGINPAGSSSTGTVTNVATTGPITGGPITTTGTIACATCLVSGGALGTPSSGTLTNATGLPLSTGVSGTLAAAQFPALTGDLTTSAGALATTLATTGATAASCGDTTHSCSLTVNTKGQITANSNNAIAASGANTALSNLAAVAINTAPLSAATNTIALGSAGNVWSNLFSTTYTCGITGTTSCVITGSGSTSGTATITWPAVAGTTTNAIVSSNTFNAPNFTMSSGNAGAPAICSTAACGSPSGIYFTGNAVGITAFGTAQVLFDENATPEFTMSNGGILDWGATTVTSTPDTGICRQGAGVVEISTSTTCNSQGKLQSAAYFHVGSTFTATGCGTPTSLTGGATAGSFLAQATSCTPVVTMGNSATAPNGWACSIWDVTTTADTLKQTASTTTTATFTGTVVSADKIIFSCEGF